MQDTVLGAGEYKDKLLLSESFLTSTPELVEKNVR